MRLSAVLTEMIGIPEYKIYNEREFENLALVEGEHRPSSLCTFVDDEKFLSRICDKVHMVITTQALKDKLTGQPAGVCVCNSPRLLYFMVHNHLAEQCWYARRVFATILGKNCTISPLASIAENNVVVGNNVVIEDFAVIKEHTVLGDGCIVRSGAVIGGEGFENKRCPDHTLMPVTHLGGVVVGDCAEIRYNTCVDRALYPWDNTTLGDYVKIDNLSYIAHGCHIGNRVIISANVDMSGRVSVGDDSWIGASAVIRNGLALGRGSKVNMAAVVTQNVPEDTAVTGYFAVPHKTFLDVFKKLFK